jgi:topoisomerase IA-like protein
MKLKINIEFRDKFNGTMYTKDSIVEFEEDRAKELLSDKRKLVSKVKEEAPEAEEAQDEKKTEDTKPKKKKK